jgi:hypothetical protein
MTAAVVGHVTQDVDDENVLVAAHGNPSISTGRTASRTHTPRSTIWRVLHQSIAPLPFAACTRDTARDCDSQLQFCRYVPHKNVDEPDFLSRVQWTVEAELARSGTTN